MKTGIVCVLAFIALVNGEDGIHARSSREIKLRDVSPYKHLLRTRSTEENEEVVQVCEPESTKMEDCNHCFCVADGSGWACTLMFCVETADQENTSSNPDEADPSSRVERDVDAPFTCEPNKTFALDCNSCICSADGRSAACTAMGCNWFNAKDITNNPE